MGDKISVDMQTSVSQESVNWHQLNVDQVCDHFSVSPSVGLNDEQLARARQRYGLNRIPETKARSAFSILLSQFSDFMVIMLLVAAVISGLVGELADTITIIVIVVLNASLGFVQELRAEKAITALKTLAAPNASVKRNGKVVEIPAEELVPGDVVLIEAGVLVAADIRLVEVATLRCDESTLTGESEPVNKSNAVITQQSPALGDQHNMLFKGSQVTHGRGLGVVTGTGLDTVLGKIASLMEADDSVKTPLQQRLTVLGRQLAVIVLFICVVIFVFGVIRGEPLMLMLLTAVSLAVAAIPEALPAVVSITLAIGARKMVNQNALIRSLPAVESLGSVTYICTDKTGTLTLNQMQAKQFYAGESWSADLALIQPSSQREQLILSMLLCNDAEVAPDAFRGDPTEVAILSAAQGTGMDKKQAQMEYPRIAEVPFDSARKSMSTIHPRGQQFVVYCKGSPERILDICRTQWSDNGHSPLDKTRHLDQAIQLAQQGYRVMAFATRVCDACPTVQDVDDVETDMVFLGLVALVDPPREEAKQAVAMCKSAGIVPIMITGDHASTANAIAQQLGIAGPDAEVISGSELSTMSDAQLQQKVKQVTVYARISPEQKIRIVEALQHFGEYVAMTGDGVNDAPALRRAHIGIAMGKKGTDVAREASDVILLDDNFATIVFAVRTGRRIYDNIRKFVKYTLTSNTGEIWTLLLAPLMGMPIPLLPIHILWINLVTDGLPGLALSFEKAEPNVMDRPPRRPGENIFARGMWQHILAIGLLIGFLSIGVQFWAIENGNPHWQTLAFTVLTFSQLVQAIAIRSEYVSIFKLGIMSNIKLLLAVLLTVILQLTIIYLPIFNDIFRTQPLSLSELLICFTLPLVVLIFVEFEKWLLRRGKIHAINAGKSKAG